MIIITPEQKNSYQIQKIYIFKIQLRILIQLKINQMTDNNRIHQAMEVMSRTLGKELETLGPAAQMKMQSVMQNCYNKSGENPDRFAQCLVDNQKRLTEVMQGFQFKMVFLSRNVQECLAKGKSVNDCGEQAAKIGKNVIDSTNKQLSKF